MSASPSHVSELTFGKRLYLTASLTQGSLTQKQNNNSEDYTISLLLRNLFHIIQSLLKLQTQYEMVTNTLKITKDKSMLVCLV